MNSRKKIFFILGVAVLLILVSIPAYAEMIQGEIKLLNPDANQIVIKRTSSAQAGQKTPLEFDVNVLPGTEFAGIISLQELRPGDEVTVNATRNKKTGKWEAHALVLDKVKIQ